MSSKTCMLCEMVSILASCDIRHNSFVKQKKNIFCLK